MKSQTVDVQALLDRLQRIESQNRVLRRLLLVLLFLVGGTFFMSRAGPGRRLVAQEVLIEDAQGTVRAKLEITGREPRLTVLDSQWTRDSGFKVRPSLNRQLSIDNAAQPIANRQAAGISATPAANAGGAFRPIVNGQLSPVNSAPHPATAKGGVGSIVNRQSTIVNSGAGSYRTDGKLRAHLDYPKDLISTLPWSTRPLPALEPAPELGTHLSNTSHMPGRRELPAPTQLRSITNNSRGRHSVPSANDLEAKWESLQQFRSREVAQLTRNPFEFAHHPGRQPAHPPRSVVKVAPVSAPSPLPAADPPPVTPSVALKAIGYAERGTSRQVVISSDNSIYVVEEGGTFLERLKVLKITPTVVEIEDELTHQPLSLSISP